MKTAVITLKEYQGFQRAYDFFNRELFAGSLPQVLVTLQRHANTRGYFAPFRFKGRIDKQTVHELALNPDNFTGRSDELILSTLTHEMCACLAGDPWRTLTPWVSQPAMGGKNARGRLAANIDRGAGRNGNRAVNDSLHSP